MGNKYWIAETELKAMRRNRIGATAHELKYINAEVSRILNRVRKKENLDFGELREKHPYLYEALEGK